MAAGPARPVHRAAQEQRQHPGAIVAQRHLRADEGALGQGERARRSGAQAVRAAIERALAAEGAAPLADRTLVNLVLQAMVGAWPISRERAVDYALKAARESGTATAWVDGDEAFEADLSGLIDLVLEDPAVRGTVEGIVRRVQAPGWSNALSQKLIQLTVPGVPDVYQGSEQWAPALVDPDNRRPVDHAEIAQRLAALDERRDDPSVAREHSVPAVDETGDAKLLVTSRALRLRRDRPELFSDYAPLQAEGEQAEHLFAFDRGGALTLLQLYDGGRIAPRWDRDRSKDEIARACLGLDVVDRVEKEI